MGDFFREVPHTPQELWIGGQVIQMGKPVESPLYAKQWANPQPSCLAPSALMGTPAPSRGRGREFKMYPHLNKQFFHRFTARRARCATRQRCGKQGGRTRAATIPRYRRA